MLMAFIIVVYMLLLPITLIAFLWKILDKIDELQETTKKQEIVSKRTHPVMQKSNYDNAFGGRKAYDIYKNKDGLYEPITPSKGIRLEKKKEE